MIQEPPRAASHNQRIQQMYPSMVLINVRLIGFTLLCLAAACSPGPAGDRDGNPAQEKTGHWPNHPDFKTSPQQAAMPDTLLVVKETKTLRPKFPALDFHYHGGDLASEEDYRTLIAVMDEAGVGMISDMDGGSGEGFDRRLELAQRFQDRFLLFARVDWKGINEPGWSGLAAAELERLPLAGVGSSDAERQFVELVPRLLDQHAGGGDFLGVERLADQAHQPQSAEPAAFEPRPRQDEPPGGAVAGEDQRIDGEHRGDAGEAHAPEPAARRRQIDGEQNGGEQTEPGDQIDDAECAQV